MTQDSTPRSGVRRSGVFGKIAVSFVILVTLVITINGALDIWFAYSETTQHLLKNQTENAKATGGRIEQFVSEIERQISWVTRASSTAEDRRNDYALLLQQVPSIDRMIFLDGNGREQLKLTRDQLVVSGNTDYSGDPRYRETRNRALWLSPIYFDGPDPFMAIAMAHSGRNAGSTVAEIRLNTLRNFIDKSRLDENISAYVVDPRGRLIAHSDLNQRVGPDIADLPQVKAAIEPNAPPVTIGTDLQGRSVLTAGAPVPRLGWHVFFEQPLNTALAPVYTLLFRTASLLLLGVALSVLAGMLLARHLVTPIRALQVGASQLEASDFGHRIDVRTGDEIEELADQFNRMADQLQGSYTRLEQKVAERTRDLARSVSELKALEEIGRAVASSLDTNAVLGTIVARAVELTHADAGQIYVYEEASGLFQLAESHALDPSLQASVWARPIRPAESVLGIAAERRETISIPDFSAAATDPLRDLALAAGFKSALVIPLIGQDGILGALVLHRRESGDFPPNMIGLMQTFAHQSALALNNARLFLEVDQKGRSLSIASEHKSQFIANMNHELRTPLNAVLGYSELLADGLYGELPEKARTVLERIQANGRHLLGLINDILDISKIEAGQLSLALDDYSVEAMVQAVVAATGSLAQAKGIRINTDVPEGLPLARGDERRLSQVLLNLVSNAIKFTERGSVDIRVRIASGELVISVQDTGPGIAPADRARIFEEFQQVDNSSTRRKGGTGLGLSISRRLVDMHGGRIELESTLGRGSTFSIVLPIRVDEQKQAVLEQAS